LLRFIPGVGKFAQWYSDYLFRAPTGYIPRLKVALAKEIFQRNLERYPNWSRDEVLVHTARQANAITGGMNYTAMGRSKTFQDLMRLTFLAPDFLGARIARGIQAVKPGGKEQAVAILRSVLGLYAGYKISEWIAHAVEPDKNEIHWEKPFSAIIGGKEYSMRSWVGDAYHLYEDPRSFVYYRMNPTWSRMLPWFIPERMGGHRDEFGNYVGFGQMAKDVAEHWVPIPGQGFFTKKDFDTYQSMLQALGVGSWQYRTEAEAMARTIAQRKALRGEETPEARERRELRAKLADEFKQHKDISKLYQAVRDRQITQKDFRAVLQRAMETPEEQMGREVKGFNVPEALKVWDEAKDAEKQMLKPIILDKYDNWDATPKQKAAVRDQMARVMLWQPKETRPKGRFSILER
jgi:hypothetical protein